MTWITPQLNKQIQVRIPINTANNVGGYDRSYDTVSTIWGGYKPKNNARYVRGVQTVSLPVNNQNVGTHEFIIRRVAIDTLGTAFSTAFSSGFDSIADLRPLKSEFFFFVQDSSTVKGRLFRIINIEDNNEQKEFLKIACKEMEETGTGYKE